MTFRTWLLEQRHRRDSIGDLARDVAATPRLDAFVDADDLLRQVNDLGWDASRRAEGAMDSAESEWRQAVNSQRKHEYAVVADSSLIVPGPGDLTSDEVAKETTAALWKVLDTVNQSLDTMPGQGDGPPGGWEIVSHTVTRIDRHLVFTFLLRR